MPHQPRLPIPTFHIPLKQVAKSTVRLNIHFAPPDREPLRNHSLHLRDRRRPISPDVRADSLAPMHDERPLVTFILTPD